MSLVFFSPLLVGVFDMFWWFWNNVTWSGIEYGTSARPLVIGFFCIPAFASGGVGIMILDTAKLIEGNRNE